MKSSGVSVGLDGGGGGIPLYTTSKPLEQVLTRDYCKKISIMITCGVIEISV